MHQTRKGNQGYFGMQAHLGADRDRKLVHPVVCTAAHVSDLAKTAELLHGEETRASTPTPAPPEWKSAEKSPPWDGRSTGRSPSSAASSRAWRKAWKKPRSRPWRKPKPPCEHSWNTPLPAPSGAALRAKAPPFGYLAPLGSHRQEPLPAPQDALPGTGQKRPPTPPSLRPGPPGHRRPPGHRLKPGPKRRKGPKAEAKPARSTSDRGKKSRARPDSRQIPAPKIRCPGPHELENKTRP